VEPDDGYEDDPGQGENRQDQEETAEETHRGMVVERLESGPARRPVISSAGGQGSCLGGYVVEDRPERAGGPFGLATAVAQPFDLVDARQVDAGQGPASP
jgi:hypothetical protein